MKRRASRGSGAKLGSKANGSESVINLVIENMPKMLTGMDQKVAWVVFGLHFAKARTSRPTGEESAPNLPLSLNTEHGKPVCPPFGQADCKER